MSKVSQHDTSYARSSHLKEFLTSTVPKLREIVQEAAKGAKIEHPLLQMQLLQVSLECSFRLFDEERDFVTAGNKSPADVTKITNRRYMLMRTLVAKDPSIEPLIQAMDKIAQYAAAAQLAFMLSGPAVRGTAWGIVEEVLNLS